MDEQVRVAGEVARAVEVPLVADAGAGFGEPLHTMRTVREFAAAGVAGIHIEDQLFPKRAHYHKYVAHAVPLPEFVDKIKWASRERDRIDGDFVIIARSDTCREFGLDEAIARVNAAAEVGADLGLVFPRNDSEAEAAPKRAKLLLVWVQSRGNRDGRPIYSLAELQAMGYRACIDAQLLLGVAVHFMKEALAEMLQTGRYTGVGDNQFTALRKEIEDMIGLDSYYEVEAETVEKADAE
jgi:methylisocitrate lyase